MSRKSLLLLVLTGACNGPPPCQPPSGDVRNYQVTSVQLPTAERPFGQTNGMLKLLVLNATENGIDAQALVDNNVGSSWQLSIASDDVRTTLSSSGGSTQVCGSPAQFPLAMPFFPSRTVPVSGLQIAWTNGSDGTISGQLNGAVRTADLATFEQVLADLVTQEAPATVTTLLDTGCGPDATGASDGVIEMCEIATNVVMEDVLRPDVALDGGAPDAWSFGFGFVAQVRP